MSFLYDKKERPVSCLGITPGCGRTTDGKSHRQSYRSQVGNVEKFYDFSDVQQKQVEKLAKNPFKYEKFWSDFDKNGANDPAKNLSLQAGELELISIMQSNGRNCCMISDKLLYEGDSIKGFTVERINDKSVQLKSEEMKIELKLSD